MSLKNKHQKTNNSRPACWEQSDNTIALKIELPSGETHILPYTKFSHAHLIKQNTNQTLTIDFQTHLLTITGTHLINILPNLQNQTLNSIQQSQPNQAPKNTSTTISSIQVETQNQI